MTLLRLSMLALVLGACHSTKASPAPASSSPSTAVVEAGPAPRDERATVDAWSAAHNAHDASALEPLYADEVTFYHVKLSRADCVARVRKFMASHASLSEKVHDVVVTPQGDGAYVTFVKSVTDGGKTRDYPSYLRLEKGPLGFVISTEGDEITDKNLEAAASACTPIAWQGDWPYQTPVLELSGTIGTGAGDNAKMEREDYFTLKLDKPICLPKSDDSAGGGVAQASVLQLVAPDPEPTVGKHVTAKGDLFLPHTAHHHEAALMFVKAIRQR